MARLDTSGRVLKWFTTALCLLTALAFFYSARRVLSWTSSSLQHDASLKVGAVYWGWRPALWQRETARYPGTPGWRVASYGGPPRLQWWIEHRANRAWEWIGISLWMPFVLFAVAAGVLWYRDRRTIPDTINRMAEWLSQGGHRRMTMWLVATCGVLHLGAVGLVFMAVLWGCHFLFPHSSECRPSAAEGIVFSVAEYALPMLVLLFPAWGLLWAKLYVDGVNRLVARRHGPHCRECGYNLTGNVSGRCPECGTATTTGCPVETP